MLDKWDNLIIRECKSKSPNARKLRKIMALRNRVDIEDIQDVYLASVLLDIVLDYNLTGERLKNFILIQLLPSEQKYMRNLGLDETHTSNIIRTCVYTIRLSECTQFPNFHKSLKFRLKEKLKANLTIIN